MGCLSISVSRVGGELKASVGKVGGELKASVALVCSLPIGGALMLDETDGFFLTEGVSNYRLILE